ncbi:Uncharacterized protein Rs2_42637 [Raphanus sativus]|nr:Uncharacterized protein Rs2_42637 [Raphanus sativus]
MTATQALGYFLKWKQEHLHLLPWHVLILALLKYVVTKLIDINYLCTDLACAKLTWIKNWNEGDLLTGLEALPLVRLRQLRDEYKEEALDAEKDYAYDVDVIQAL